jgi:NTE family protein
VNTTPSLPVPPSPSRSASRKALVLGGGGSTGNAWLIGVVAGLCEAGLDVTAADLIIGTSAGSTAAAQLASAPPAELLTAALAIPPQRTRPGESNRGPAPSRPVVDLMERTSRIIAESADADDMRRRMGTAALEQAAQLDGPWQAQWRATVASRLPRQDWPDRAVLITAVDASSGQPVVFDRYSGVDLADAVAASCSSGRAYRIGDASYIDGGYRSNAENADLATGCSRVLVLSPFGGRTRTPQEWNLDLATQIAELRAGGSRVETVFPDSDSEHLFGVNAMDPFLRAPAARAGHDQGRARAAELAAFWG